MDNWANTFIRLAFVVTFMSTGLIALPVLDKVNQGAAQEGVHPPLTGGDGEVSDDPNSLDTAKFIVGDVEFPLHRNAIRDRSKRWPGGIVPYVIDNDYPDTARLSILESLQEIESDVESNGTKCIQFIPRTTESNYLRIKRGTGCHSPIGDDPDEGTDVIISTLGPGCETKGVAMHEMLHVLGFYHEQNRPDRDLYVDINETNVGNVRDFYIRNDTVIDTLGFPYDFSSITHYAAYNMAKDYAYPVLTPKPQYAARLRMGQRHSLSTTDVLKIQRLYGCVEDSSHAHSDLENAILYSCDFSDGTCGFSYHHSTVQPSDQGTVGVGEVRADYTPVKWTQTSGMTRDGPRAGYTNGRDPYLYASKGENPSDGNSSVTGPTQTADDTTAQYSAVPRSVSPLAPPSTLVVTSAVTPLLTAPDDGKVCVGLQVFQKGPSSYLSVYLLETGSTRQPLRVYNIGSADRWGRDSIEVQLGASRTFRVELEATLVEGGLGVDDFFVFRGKCVNVMG